MGRDIYPVIYHPLALVTGGAGGVAQGSWGWVGGFTTCPNQELGLCQGNACWGLPGFRSDPCSRSREVKNKSVAKILPSGLSYHFARLCGVVWGLPRDEPPACNPQPSCLLAAGPLDAARVTASRLCLAGSLKTRRRPASTWTCGEWQHPQPVTLTPGPEEGLASQEASWGGPSTCTL